MSATYGNDQDLLRLEQEKIESGEQAEVDRTRRIGLAQQEKEAPGFVEALYAKEDHNMVAILVDSETNIIQKITHVPLEEMFIERMVMSWNPYKTAGDEYTKTYTSESFITKINEIFKMKSSEELWRTSW